MVVAAWSAVQQHDRRPFAHRRAVGHECWTVDIEPESGSIHLHLHAPPPSHGLPLGSTRVTGPERANECREQERCTALQRHFGVSAARRGRCAFWGSRPDSSCIPIRRSVARQRPTCQDESRQAATRVGRYRRATAPDRNSWRSTSSSWMRRADRRATSARVRQGPAAQGTRTRRSVPDLLTPRGVSRHPRTGPRRAPA